MLAAASSCAASGASGASCTTACARRGRCSRGDRLLIVGAITYYAFDVAALLPTPGGVGGTEGGLIGMFVLYGAPVGLATAAVLGYRVFQLGLPAILGAISMLRIRKLLADDSRRAAVAAPSRLREGRTS